MAVCTQCGAPIRWVSTQTGRRLTLAIEPALWSTLHSCVLEDNVARLADPRRDHSAVPRYRTHWVTCTRAFPDTIDATAPARVLPARFRSADARARAALSASTAFHHHNRGAPGSACDDATADAAPLAPPGCAPRTRSWVQFDTVQWLVPSCRTPCLAAHAPE